MNRETRNLLHTKQNRNVVAAKAPQSVDGNDGDIRICRVSGGIKLFAKYNGIWYLTSITTKTTVDSSVVSSDTILTGQSINSSVVMGELVYFTGTEWDETDADAESTTKPMVGIYRGSNEVLMYGIYTTSSLTAGNVYYVSTTVGEWTNTAPSGSGDFVRIIGYALSTTQLFFNPSGTWVKVA